MAYYECSLSMEAAYTAWVHLHYGDMAERALRMSGTRLLRRLGLVRQEPEYLRQARSPDYRAAASIKQAVEGRIVAALIVGERLSSGSEVTVLIHEDDKEVFYEALDATRDNCDQYEYREQSMPATAGTSIASTAGACLGISRQISGLVRTLTTTKTSLDGGHLREVSALPLTSESGSER